MANLVRRLALLLLITGLSVVSACGEPKEDLFGVGEISVTSIAPPMPLGVPTPFTITGTGFDNLVGAEVSIRFIASSGTPFGGSDSFSVTGTVASPTTIEGTSAAFAGGGDTFMATVRVTLFSGVQDTSDAAIAVFLGDPPVATDDPAYTATGNVLLTVDAASGVLDNDTPGGLSVSAHDPLSANGGTVAVNADGSFTYDPPVGFNGPDTFMYTASDGFQTDTALVTVTVSDMVWFIDATAAAGGDGRRSTRWPTSTPSRGARPPTGTPSTSTRPVPAGGHPTQAASRCCPTSC